MAHGHRRRLQSNCACFPFFQERSRQEKRRGEAGGEEKSFYDKRPLARHLDADAVALLTAVSRLLRRKAYDGRQSKRDREMHDKERRRLIALLSRLCLRVRRLTSRRRETAVLISDAGCITAHNSRRREMEHQVTGARASSWYQQRQRETHLHPLSGQSFTERAWHLTSCR